MTRKLSSAKNIKGSETADIIKTKLWKSNKGNIFSGNISLVRYSVGILEWKKINYTLWTGRHEKLWQRIEFTWHRVKHCTFSKWYFRLCRKWRRKSFFLHQDQWEDRLLSFSKSQRNLPEYKGLFGKRALFEKRKKELHIFFTIVNLWNNLDQKEHLMSKRY